MNKNDRKKKLVLNSATVVQLTRSLTPEQLALAAGGMPSSMTTVRTETCASGRACNDTGC